MNWDYWKHLLVRTRLEPALREARTFAQLVAGFRRPELLAQEAESARLQQLYARILRKNACCVDVGADLGLELSQFVQQAPQGRHMAFEPLPSKASWLARKFPEVEVLPLLVGEQRGPVAFYVSGPLAGQIAGSERLTQQRSRCIEVSMVRLDDFTLERRVDLLKLDVAGEELSVLRGARQLLARCRPHVLLAARSRLAADHGARRELFRWFEQQDYALFALADFLYEGHPLELAEFQESHADPHSVFKFLAVPVEQVSRRRALPNAHWRSLRPQA